ncbi:MAG TPA: indole-3-glycerol phosphate synthase TrpC [Hanamia sp.]
MNILDTIVAKKKIEVARDKLIRNIAALEKEVFYKKETKSFIDFLLRKDKTGIIAEFKRKSPSKGIINDTSTVEDVTANYVKYGASAISILTDETFFGGSLTDLLKATLYDIPILRKDFIVDEYQVIESKAYGADIILLIAACLSKKEVKTLASLAKNIGLNVLLEIHNEDELNHICDEIDVTGINNRDLKTFKVDLKHSIELCKKIPADKIKISESGIDDPQTIRHLKENGFSGFLMSEKFMKEKNPGEAFGDFIKMIN